MCAHAYCMQPVTTQVAFPAACCSTCVICTSVLSSAVTWLRAHTLLFQEEGLMQAYKHNWLWRKQGAKSPTTTATACFSTWPAAARQKATLFSLPSNKVDGAGEYLQSLTPHRTARLARSITPLCHIVCVCNESDVFMFARSAKHGESGSDQVGSRLAALCSLVRRATLKVRCTQQPRPESLSPLFLTREDAVVVVWLQAARTWLGCHGTRCSLVYSRTAPLVWVPCDSVACTAECCSFRTRYLMDTLQPGVEC
jgi:hypothetical protein